MRSGPKSRAGQSDAERGAAGRGIVQRFAEKLAESGSLDAAAAIGAEPAALLPLNPSGVVTELAFFLWTSRADLKRRFHLRDRQSKLEFAEWLVTGGAREAGLPESVTAVMRRRLAIALGRKPSSLPPNHVSGRLSKSLLESAQRLQGIVALVPEWVRRRIFLRLLASSAAGPDSSLGGGDRPALSPRLKPGVCLVGYAFAEIGMGETLRSMAGSMVAADVPVDVLNFSDHVLARQADRSIDHLVGSTMERKVNLLCVNADLLGSTLGELGERTTAGRYNIVRPFWELPQLLPEWRPQLARMHEMWAPTRFVGEIFSRSVDVPVVHIPMAVSVPGVAPPDRRRFGLSDDAYLFLFSFDMASFPARKNPEAVVRAFELAFGGTRDPVGLVVKSMGSGPGRDEAVARLRSLAGRDPRIHLIDETLDRADASALMAAADCFVSLHRAEGFGYGMAEAMLMGKPVIATNYSGNTDFLTQETGFPVPYELRPVVEGEYPYFMAGQLWAEPDVAAAAGLMRQLFDHQDLGKAVGEAGRLHMIAHHSPEVVGRVIRRRLEHLGMLG